MYSLSKIHLKTKACICGMLGLIFISSCATTPKLMKGIDEQGNPVCLSNCGEIPDSIEKFKKIHLLNSEKDEIEYLLYRIRSSKSQFDRNGQKYRPPEATKFIRWKMEWYEGHFGEKIDTDEALVSKVLSGSKASGKPYEIIKEDGNRYNAQTIMQNELNALDNFNSRNSSPAHPAR